MTRGLTGTAAIAATAWLVVVTAPESHGAEKFGNVVATPLSFAADDLSHGYVEHRVKLLNLSSVKSYEVKLTCPDMSYSGGDSISRISRTVVLGPSAEAIVSMGQPPLELSGNAAMRIRVRGGPGGKFSAPSLNQSYNVYHRQRICVLVSRRVNRDDLMRAISLPASFSRGPRRRHSPGDRWSLTRSELPIADWSDSWLGYSCFDGVVIARADMADMPGPVRLALEQYVESGGTLAVMGGGEAPKTWSEYHGRVPRGIRMYHTGFGQCIFYDGDDLRRLGPDQASLLCHNWDYTFSPWQSRRDVNYGHKALPVVENIRVPVRGLFFAILAFSLLIGPVNVFVLARKGKRIWLLWTVPAISFVTCLCLAIYSLLAEGTTATVRMRSFTILDERTRRATTLGLAGYYCPLTPAEGLHFEHDTEVTPLVRSRYHGGGSDRRIELTEDQHLSVGWITARAPAYFLVRKSEPRWERVQIRRGDDGTVTAMNGLGTEIKEFWFADEEGYIHSGGSIPAGTHASLERADFRCSGRRYSRRLRDVYTSQDWARSALSVTQNVATVLWPGTYLALLDDCVFIEPGLNGKAKKTASSTVLGISGNGSREGDE